MLLVIFFFLSGRVPGCDTGDDLLHTAVLYAVQQVLVIFFALKSPAVVLIVVDFRQLVCGAGRIPYDVLLRVGEVMGYPRQKWLSMSTLMRCSMVIDMVFSF